MALLERQVHSPSDPLRTEHRALLGASPKTRPVGVNHVHVRVRVRGGARLVNCSGVVVAVVCGGGGGGGGVVGGGVVGWCWC